jgi:hypothetical protein
MKAKYQAAVQALDRHLRWVQKLTPRMLADEAAQERIHDVVVWCLDFVELSPTTKLAAWLARKPGRRGLYDPCRAARTERGRQAIQELICLTISELEASAPFLPSVEAGLLPGVAPSGAATQRQLEALRLGRQAQNSRKRARDDAVAKRVAFLATVQ